ncbi:UNVERIFIED_CONTAM: protein MALE DISCOVERER 2 [Sesamum angustifolium]|uniref:Protein MALE DISCOVERER 2 n=1 Tax=Sesamum angustifolium TaxID=2727405 RepID=A0AAW2LDP1_9LAMI
MKEFWRSRSRLAAAFPVFCLYLLNLSSCWSLNDEGAALLRFKERILSDPHGALSNWIDEVGVESPCSWFGVECSEGYVVVLVETRRAPIAIVANSKTRIGSVDGPSYDSLAKNLFVATHFSNCNYGDDLTAYSD